MTITPFHLAFPVTDLAASREFYGELIGCPEGRSSDRWIDFDFFGHQLVAHLVEEHPNRIEQQGLASNVVDGHDVPVPHFGVVLEWSDWESLADRLKRAETAFVIEPYIRFAGEPGEQATMFLMDPSGNALEFKAFKDASQLFAV